MRSAFILAIAMLAVGASALPAPEPCETTVDYGYHAAPINVLSNNGKNSGIISSGNDNGYHQGDGSTYQSGTNGSQSADAASGSKAKSDSNASAVAIAGVPAASNATSSSSAWGSSHTAAKKDKAPSTTTVKFTSTLTATKWSAATGI